MRNLLDVVHINTVIFTLARSVPVELCFYRRFKRIINDDNQNPDDGVLIMRSPVGSRKQMEPVQLEDGLMAYRCPDTGGIYIPSASYMRWLSQQPARKQQLPETGAEQQTLQTDRPAAICPESGTIMTRYKVGHGFKFTIDRSVTGGIWLDAGEWDALRQRNFHDELNLIFTQSLAAQHPASGAETGPPPADGAKIRCRAAQPD
jgi:hypothetical protein